MLGEKLFEVALCATPYPLLRSVARPEMKRLAEKTGETVFLSVLTPRLDVVHVERVPSTQIIRYDEELGQRHPAYCSAPGRVFLAYLPGGRLATYLRQVKYERLTERTVTSQAVLLRELRRIRRLGVGFNFDEQEMGASAISAPIVAGPERVIAAVVVAGPSERIRSRREGIAAAVKQTGADISEFFRVDGIGADSSATPNTVETKRGRSAPRPKRMRAVS